MSRSRQWATEAIAKETIGFQKDGFGDRITAIYRSMKEYLDQNPKISKSEFIAAIGKDRAKELSELLTGRFGINFAVNFNSYSTGMVHVFPINRNSILLKDWIRDRYEDGGQTLLTKTLNEKKGTLDLKNAKASGIFSLYTHKLMMDVYTNMVSGWKGYGEQSLLPEECAAITLHEVGHAFTYYEMADRLESTNRVLAQVADIVRNKKNLDKKEYVYKELGETLDFTKEEMADLMEESSGLIIGSRIFKKFIQKVQSQMPVGKYDETSSEQLADDFAVKFGYGKHLVAGLDKIHRYWGDPNVSYFQAGWALSIELLLTFWQAASLISFITGGMIITGAVFGAILIVILYSSGSSHQDMTYDTVKDRYTRIRNQIVASLDEEDLTSEDQKEILAAIDFVDDRIKDVHRYQSLWTIVSNFVFSSNRAVRDSIAEQQLLEELSHNDLFVEAARFRTL